MHISRKSSDTLDYRSYAYHKNDDSSTNNRYFDTNNDVHYSNNRDRYANASGGQTAPCCPATYSGPQEETRYRGAEGPLGEGQRCPNWGFGCRARRSDRSLVSCTPARHPRETPGTRARGASARRPTAPSY